MKQTDVKEIVESWKQLPLERFKEQLDIHERAITRHECEIKHYAQQIVDLDVNHKYYIDRIQRLTGDMKTAASFLKDDKQLFEAAKPEYEKLERETALLAESKKPQYKVLRDFMKQWEDDCIAYYDGLLGNGYDGKDKYVISMLDKGLDVIKKIYKYEAKARLANMVAEIKDKTGEVQKCNIYPSTNNHDFGFDGTVTGEKGTVKIQAVLAGGWNIQKLHVRVLINKIK